ncbi:hypothetical protein PDE_02894 [Penicillium oxalicum 114-2]|uniref:Uncharacterized protein n=1 Tax=Penicillium oxalicum (strain 114-2 / CGMCC 5302) TaxID=933388 RepID=S7ZBJ2_PENO1|nr:hypothetical protein PDE_02894 [Penicillium oxalicum 114-2]
MEAQLVSRLNNPDGRRTEVDLRCRCDCLRRFQRFFVVSDSAGKQTKQRDGAEYPEELAAAVQTVEPVKAEGRGGTHLQVEWSPTEVAASGTAEKSVPAHRGWNDDIKKTQGDSNRGPTWDASEATTGAKTLSIQFTPEDPPRE